MLHRSGRRIHLILFYDLCSICLAYTRFFFSLHSSVRISLEESIWKCFCVRIRVRFFLSLMIFICIEVTFCCLLSINFNAECIPRSAFFLRRKKLSFLSFFHFSFLNLIKQVHEVGVVTKWVSWF